MVSRAAHHSRRWAYLDRHCARRAQLTFPCGGSRLARINRLPQGALRTLGPNVPHPQGAPCSGWGASHWGSHPTSAAPYPAPRSINKERRRNRRLRQHPVPPVTPQGRNVKAVTGITRIKRGRAVSGSMGGDHNAAEAVPAGCFIRSLNSRWRPGEAMASRLCGSAIGGGQGAGSHQDQGQGGGYQG
jgi:hypothetical protein